MNIGLLKHGFRAATSWRLKKMLIVPLLIFHARISGERLLAHTLLSSTTSQWGCCKKWFCRLCWCSSTFSFCSLKVLEQRVSGTMDRTDWTNSMGCRSPDLNHWDLYFWGYSKSTVYSTLWRPVLATVNTECNWNYSYDSCNFPASKTPQTYTVLPRSPWWTLAIFCSQGGRKSETVF